MQGTKKIHADEGQSAENSGGFSPEELEVIEHPNRNLTQARFKMLKEIKKEIGFINDKRALCETKGHG